MASCDFMIKRKKVTPLTITRLTLSQLFSLSDSVVLDTLLLGRAYTDLCPDTVGGCV